MDHLLQPLLLGALLLAVLLLVLAAVWYWRRRSRQLAQRLKGRIWGHAQDVVIPDGMDGHIHIDHVLLTRRGLIVLELKELRGSVFGAEKMSEWVVIEEGRRYGFRNPLTELDERLAALRAFAEGIRIEAYVLIIGPVGFPKGRPERTLRMDDLADKLEPVNGDMPDGWRGLWNKIAGRAER